ncbi:MAG: cytochrome P450 [Deltaproteobacteria bacterium]|nr:MAG: cytochrome P450 [Deltaproteobacteria bacterium]
MKDQKGPKTPPLDPIVGFATGHMLQMMKDRFSFLQSAMINQGDFVHFRYLRSDIYLVLDPEGIKQVLHTGQSKYSKMVRGAKFLKDIGGRGLLTSEGKFWQQSRRVIQPFFAKRQYPHYLDFMSDCANNLIKRWKENKYSDEWFDLAPEMTKFTLNVLMRSLFNADFDEHTETVYNELRSLLDITEDRIIHIIPRMGSSKKRQDEEFKRSLGNLESIVDELIQKSKNETQKQPDRNFIHALLESDMEFSDQDLRDHVISLMIAGHETTATALCWLFTLLETHPDAKSKVLNEIESHVSSNRLDLETVEKLEYLHMVIQEALRIYPPFWIMGRVATEDDVLLGHPIKKGDRIQINPYFTHHNPRYWENPEEFKPERFSKENIGKINEYVYLPFGKGPRTCLGNHFGTFEMFVGVALLYKNFTMKFENASEINPDFRITLRPDRPVKVKALVKV